MRNSQHGLLVDSVSRLLAYVRRQVGDRERANELVQEVILRILAGDGPTEPERFTAWSLGIARYVIAHDWRNRKRARAQLAPQDIMHDEPATPPPDAEGQIDARTWMARVRDDLGSEGVELLVRRYVLEETGKELADELEQTPAAIRMRLMRLRSTASASARRP